MAATAQLLTECCYGADAEPRWNSALRPVVQRGLRSLKERLEKEPAAGERLERLRRAEARLENPFAIMRGAATCEKPGSVIVHGDFCRNNMLFKYDGEDQAVGVCFFDLQNSRQVGTRFGTERFASCILVRCFECFPSLRFRYGSPAVDLSFFIFLNTSAELRATHWDELLGTYFESLESTLQRLLRGHEPPDDFGEQHCSINDKFRAVVSG